MSKYTLIDVFSGIGGFHNGFLNTERFETFLDDNNSIGSRKEGRTTTGKKESYIRDEIKLWNKLGLIKSNSSRYFVNGRGVEFNWLRITEILTKDFLY